MFDREGVWHEEGLTHELMPWLSNKINIVSFIKFF